MNRRSLRVGLATAFCLLLVTGCSYSEAATGNTKHWVTNKVVQPSSLPNAVVQFVDRAGEKVGDAHPKIVYAKTDIDDATQKPMYQINITGDFTYGSHQAKELPMIVLADGSAGAFTDPNDNAFNKINLNK